MSKISIRFYNDREVRAVWDDENLPFRVERYKIRQQAKEFKSRNM